MGVLTFLVGAALVGGVVYYARNMYREHVANQMVNQITDPSPQDVNENVREENLRDIDGDKSLDEPPYSLNENQEIINEDTTNKNRDDTHVNENLTPAESTPRADKSNNIQETHNSVKQSPKITEETSGAVKENPKITEGSSGAVKEKPKQENQGAVKEKAKITEGTSDAVKEKPKQENQKAVKEKPNNISETLSTVKGDKTIGNSGKGNNNDNPKTVNDNQDNIKKHQEIIEKLNKKIDPEINYLERHFESDFKKLTPFVEYRDVIVHLQDWKYKDIEAECSNLGIIGYAAVQLSPVTAKVRSNPPNWYDRFHILSYDIDSEFGTKEELQNMIKKCREHKVKVFVDVNINNMASSKYLNVAEKDFKNIIYKFKDGRLLYNADDFHEMCFIFTHDFKKESYDTYSSPSLQPDESATTQEDNLKSDDFHKELKLLEGVRDKYRANKDKNGFEETLKLREQIKRKILWNCWLAGFPDLKQVDDKGRPVKQMLDLFRDLLLIGVSGFRVLLAEVMNPNDLHKIYEWLPRQTTFIYHDFNFPLKSDYFIKTFLLNHKEYAKMTRFADYKYARLLARTFLNRELSISQLYQSLKELDLQSSGDRVAIVNNYSIVPTINYQQTSQDLFIIPSSLTGDIAYKLATAFMLISDHGIPAITSTQFVSYSGIKIMRYEHLWPSVKGMIDFRYILKKQNNGIIPAPSNFVEYDRSQASFCLGETGFVIFNFQDTKFERADLNTCFNRNGLYCNVFEGLGTGIRGNKKCLGRVMSVNGNGKKGTISMQAYDFFAAFHVNAYI